MPDNGNQSGTNAGQNNQQPNQQPQEPHPIIKDLERIIKDTMKSSRMIENELVRSYNQHVPEEYWDRALKLEEAEEIASKIMEDLKRIILKKYLLKKGKPYNPNDYDEEGVEQLVKDYTGLSKDIIKRRLLDLPDLSFPEFYETIIRSASQQIRRVGTEKVNDRIYGIWEDEKAREIIGNYLKRVYEESGVKGVNVKNIIADRDRVVQEVLQYVMEKQNRERRNRILQRYQTQQNQGGG